MGTGLIRIWCKAAMLLQHSNAWTLAVQTTFQWGRLFPNSLQWTGLQWWLSFLFINCTTLQGALQIPCQPASQPASQSYYLGISHTAWSQCLSSLHISSAEVFAIGNDNHMQRYCRIRFFQPPRWYFVGRQGEGKKILSWHIKLVVTIFHVLNNYFSF